MKKTLEQLKQTNTWIDFDVNNLDFEWWDEFPGNNKQFNFISFKESSNLIPKRYFIGSTFLDDIIITKHFIDSLSFRSTTFQKKLILDNCKFSKDTEKLPFIDSNIKHLIVKNFDSDELMLLLDIIKNPDNNIYIGLIEIFVNTNKEQVEAYQKLQLHFHMSIIHSFYLMQETEWWGPSSVTITSAEKDVDEEKRKETLKIELQYKKLNSARYLTRFSFSRNTIWMCRNLFGIAELISDLNLIHSFILKQKNNFMKLNYGPTPEIELQWWSYINDFEYKHKLVFDFYIAEHYKGGGWEGYSFIWPERWRIKKLKMANSWTELENILSISNLLEFVKKFLEHKTKYEEVYERFLIASRLPKDFWDKLIQPIISITENLNDSFISECLSNQDTQFPVESNTILSRMPFFVFTPKKDVSSILEERLDNQEKYEDS